MRTTSAVHGEDIIRISRTTTATEIATDVVSALDAGRKVVVLAGARRTGLAHRVADEVRACHPGVEVIAVRSGRSVRTFFWPAAEAASAVWFYDSALPVDTHTVGIERPTSSLDG